MHSEKYRESFYLPALLSGPVIALVLFIFILPFRYQDVYALIILAASICLLSLMLTENLLDARPRPVHLLFCIYMIFFYLLPGYLHTAYGRFPFFDVGFPPTKITRGAIVAFVFIVCVGAGYSIKFISPSIARVIVLPQLGQAILLCAACSVLAAASFGFGNLLAPRADDVLADTLPSPTRLIIGAIARSGSFYAFMLAVFSFRLRKGPVELITATATLFIFLAFNSPLAIPRFVLASYLIVMFFVFVRVTRVQKLALVLAFVASQGTLFSYISYISRGDPGTAFRLSPIEYYLTSGDFDGLQSTINVVAMHDEKGGKNGINLLSAIFFFVPREIWPQKSIGTGGEAGIYAGYPFINLSSPLPSEFYVDFGIAGVIVLSLLFGLFVRICDDYFMYFKHTSDSIGQVLVGTVAGYIFIILRGSLVGTLGPIVLSLFIASICYKYSTVPAPSRDKKISSYNGDD